MILDLVDEATRNGARSSAACEVLELQERTIQRWKAQGGGDDLRAGPRSEPPNKLTTKERSRVLEIANSKEFRDRTPNEIVPTLADRGEYLCSEATMYRVLQEEKLQLHRGRSKEPERREPVARIATRRNQIWSWDITYLRGPHAGAFLYLYMVVDIWSRKIVGWEVHEREGGDLASQLLERCAREEGIALASLTLHADNGGPMKAATMLATLQRLGIAASFTRPRVCDDNPFSEALFRTLKYRPTYPETRFKGLPSARTWVADFVRWYNFDHLHSGIRFVRPIDRHEDRDNEILTHRKKVYEAAKAMNPQRWGSRATRNWDRPARVCVRARPETRSDGKVTSEAA